jgi:hypothetical protein
MPAKAIARNRLPVPVELVSRRIYIMRGRRVMLDSDLAELYGVATKRLNEAVKRNLSRFPDDFMFQLSAEELENWRSQIATSNPGAKMGLRRPPYAFTELGVAMLSSVLKSERAVQMNIVIMRAFVKLREILATNRAMAQRIEQLTATVKDHAALFDVVIKDIEALDGKVSRELRLLKAPRRRKSRIGFLAPGGR